MLLSQHSLRPQFDGAHQLLAVLLGSLAGESLDLGRKHGQSAGGSVNQPTNAHNIFLDVLALYEVVPLLTMSAALVIVVLASVSAAKSEQILPLAIVTLLLVVGLTQADHRWITPSEPWWLLILAAFIASAVNNCAEQISEKLSERL